MEDHKRIYMELTRKRGATNVRVPLGSAHLKGSAVDISDPDGSLYDWCKAHEALLVSAQLWCEEKDDQKRVHFQTYAPPSGKRFFKP